MIATLVNLTPGIIYSIWLKKIVDTHLTQAWDKEMTAQDEQEDEYLNGLWEELGENLQQRLWGLSADLNTLRDKEVVVEADWEPWTEQQLRQEQSDAFQRGDWDRLLESLRRPPRFRPQAQVDYLRGRAWMEMEHPEVAILFFDNAARLDPSNSVSRTQALECLVDLKDWNEALRRAEEYLQDQPSEPLLYCIANVFIAHASATGDHEYFRRALDVLDQFLSRLGQNHQQEINQLLVVPALASKALCLRQLGEFEKALETYDQAIRQFPNDPLMVTLFTARGLLKQQLKQPGAIEDFKKAIATGTPLVLPYLETARAALEQGRFQEAVRLCQLGLQQTRQSTYVAHLLNLMAIAFWRSGDSENAGKALERAAQLDPLNDDIQANWTTFQNQLGPNPAGSPHWEINAKTPASAIDEVFHSMQPTM